MAWPNVAVQDIIDRWRPLTTEEATTAQQRLNDALAELNLALRDRGVSGTPTFDTAEELTEWETLYTAVAVGSVRRYLMNPDGWYEEREQIDDSDFTRRRDKAVSTGEIYFTDTDIDKLVPRRRRRKGAFTIRLGQT